MQSFCWDFVSDSEQPQVCSSSDYQRFVNGIVRPDDLEKEGLYSKKEKHLTGATMTHFTWVLQDKCCLSLCMISSLICIIYTHFLPLNENSDVTEVPAIVGTQKYSVDLR